MGQSCHHLNYCRARAKADRQEQRGGGPSGTVQAPVGAGSRGMYQRGQALGGRGGGKCGKVHKHCEGVQVTGETRG